MLEIVVDLAERGRLHEDLNRTARILDLGETRLLHHVLGAHPARHPDPNRRRIEGFAALLAVRRRYVRGQRIAPEAVRKGVAALAKPRELGAPLRDQMILVVVVAHKLLRLKDPASGWLA